MSHGDHKESTDPKRSCLRRRQLNRTSLQSYPAILGGNLQGIRFETDDQAGLKRASLAMSPDEAAAV